MGKTNLDNSKKWQGSPGLPAVDAFVDQVESGLKLAIACPAGLSPYHSAAWIKCLIAFSGGPDSTALMLALCCLRQKMKLTLAACHINHGLRGQESDTDEQFCRELCRALSVPLIVRQLQLEPRQNASEAGLRQARYSMLGDAARDAGCGFIITGHTLDDQIETFLFRLFRGTGPGGLIGMQWARRLDDRTFLIRPLLSFRRADCHSYLARCRQKAADDSSNKSLKYARNYIRHQLIPAIAERFPGFEEKIEQLRQIIGQDELLLEDLTDKALIELEGAPAANVDCWQAEQFLLLPQSLQRRVVAKSLVCRGIELSFERVDSLIDLAACGGAISLNNHWDMRVEQGYMRFVDRRHAGICQADSGSMNILPGDDGIKSMDEQIKASDGALEVKIPGLSVAPAAGGALKVELWVAGGESGLSFPPAEALTALVDFSAIRMPLFLRKKQPGDVIQPFGMKEQVSLKKVLHNKKLSCRQRVSLVVLGNDQEVIWIPGIGLSEKARVLDRPTHRLTWLEISPDAAAIC